MTSLLLALFLSLSAATPPPAARPSTAVRYDDEDDTSKKKELPPDPSGKLYEKFSPTRGFYLAADVGMMWMLGGIERSYSNTQLYVGINMGYDFTKWFSWQVSVGRGFAANAARTQGQIDKIRDFSFTNFTTGPVVWIMVWERLAIEVKALGGLTLFDPAPLDATDFDDGTPEPSPFAPVVGGGLGVKYLTLLTDFTIGLEATFQYIIYPTPMPVINVSPLAVRYTF